MSESVSLKEWTEQRVQHAEKTAEARFVANEAAVATASAQLTIRLDHANGLIGQMHTQAQEFARKTEVDLKIESLRARIEALDRGAAHTGGRETLTHPIIMLIVGAVVGYLALKLGGK